jgi:hypothetical protein
MARKKEGTNPFYLLLVIVGVAFTITACAYGVMIFKAMHPTPAIAGQPNGENLLAFMSDYGAWLLTVELLLLAGMTVGAMATDSYWIRREKESREEREKGL